MKKARQDNNAKGFALAIALRQTLQATFGWLLCISIVASAVAQEYPSRPITLVVPFPPGGTNDAMARIVSEKLAQALKQPVVIENRGAGGGTVGMRSVAQAAADGYTILLAHSGTLAMTPFLMSNPGYDAKKFSAIGLIAATPIVVMVHPAVAGSMQELVEIAKSRPEKLALGTPTLGTGGFMSAQVFKRAIGTDMPIIAYKGTAALTNDLIGGHVPVGFNQIAPALGSIEAGKIRALAVATPARSALLPDVPTTAEVGLPEMIAELHFGLVAPARTPRAIIDQLSRVLNEIVRLPEVQKRIIAEGGEPLPMSASDYDEDIGRDVEKWGGLIRTLGLRIDQP